MTSDSDKLHQLTQMLDTMGVPWAVLVRASLSAMDPALGPAQHVKTLVEEFRRRLPDADAQLALEQTRAATVLASTPREEPLRAELLDMVLAFTEQREGLRLLARYFDEGDDALLAQAGEKVQRGAMTAHAASRRALGR